jgi:hypothetical protein
LTYKDDELEIIENSNLLDQCNESNNIIRNSTDPNIKLDLIQTISNLSNSLINYVYNTLLATKQSSDQLYEKAQNNIKEQLNNLKPWFDISNTNINMEERELARKIQNDLLQAEANIIKELNRNNKAFYKVVGRSTVALGAIATSLIIAIKTGAIPKKPKIKKWF